MEATYEEDDAAKFLAERTGTTIEEAETFIEARRTGPASELTEGELFYVEGHFEVPDDILRDVLGKTQLPVHKIIKLIVEEVAYMKSIGLMEGSFYQTALEWKAEQLGEAEAIH
jgi:hypothetical protein